VVTPPTDGTGTATPVLVAETAQGTVTLVTDRALPPATRSVAASGAEPSRAIVSVLPARAAPPRSTLQAGPGAPVAIDIAARLSARVIGPSLLPGATSLPPAPPSRSRSSHRRAGDGSTGQPRAGEHGAKPPPSEAGHARSCRSASRRMGRLAPPRLAAAAVEPVKKGAVVNAPAPSAAPPDAATSASPQAEPAVALAAAAGRHLSHRSKRPSSTRRSAAWHCPSRSTRRSDRAFSSPSSAALRFRAPRVGTAPPGAPRCRRSSALRARPPRVWPTPSTPPAPSRRNRFARSSPALQPAPGRRSLPPSSSSPRRRADAPAKAGGRWPRSSMWPAPRARAKR